MEKKPVTKKLTANPSISKNFENKNRFYGDEATDFHSRKIPEIATYYICWSVMLINSVLKMNENYYLQVFSKEYKYIWKINKVIRHRIYSQLDRKK